MPTAYFDSNRRFDTLTVFTDSLGQVSTAISLGSRVGEAVVKVGVAELGLDTVLVFNIEPGQPAWISSHDTIVAVGRATRPRFSFEDRLGNPTTQRAPVVLEVTPPLRRVEDTLAVMDAIGIGDFSVRLLNSNQPGGQGRVHAVPPGRLTTIRSTTLVRDIIDSAMDGSDAVVLRDSVGPGSGLAWSPDGEWLVGPARSRQLAVSIHGGPWQDLPLPPGTTRALFPSVSADGWIYFWASAESTGGSIWRIRNDGSGLEWLDVADGGAALVGSPSLSPDGSKLGWVDYSLPGGLSIYDVATKRSKRIHSHRGAFGWFADGDSLALDQGTLGIGVIAVDGTGERTIPAWQGHGLIVIPGSRWVIQEGPARLIPLDGGTGPQIVSTTYTIQGGAWNPNR